MCVAENLGGQVRRIARERGEQDWSVVREDEGRVSGVAAVGGTVYLTATGSSLDDTIRAFDPDSGDVRWSVGTGGSLLGPPAVASGLVFVGTSLPDGGHAMALEQSW